MIFRKKPKTLLLLFRLFLPPRHRQCLHCRLPRRPHRRLTLAAPLLPPFFFSLCRNQRPLNLQRQESPRPASPDSGRPCSHEFPLWCHENEYCRCYDPHAQLSKWTRPTDGSRPRKLRFGRLSSSGYPWGFKTLPNLPPYSESDYLLLYSTPPKGVPRPVAQLVTVTAPPRGCPSHGFEPGGRPQA